MPRREASQFMSSVQRIAFFIPLTRAIAQLEDRVFLGVVARGLGWSIAFFVALHIGVLWGVHGLLDLHGVFAWAADVLGSIGASFLTLWLFLPVAAVIGTLYSDRVAMAVEQRFYPGLRSPQGAPAIEQFWDGIVVGLRVLALNVVALFLVLILPGIGLLLGWMIAAFAIGRGLFVAVAMRRMSRSMAESLYRSRRAVVLMQGGVIALLIYVPILNLILPVVGTAAMVHILNMSILGSAEEHGLHAPTRAAANRDFRY